MQTAIIKVTNIGAERKWIPIIKKLQDKGYTVHREFPKWSEVNIVLSGQFENPRGGNGKRVLVLDQNEWYPAGVGWERLYKNLVSPFYDEIVDVTDKTFGETANIIAEFADAKKRQTN